MPVLLAAFAAALVLAAAGLALALRARRELQQLRDREAEHSSAQQARADLAEQRTLELGEHLIALERRVNLALEQRMLQRADIDSGAAGDSEQARQLRAASATGSQPIEADAEARLRALLAQRGE